MGVPLRLKLICCEIFCREACHLIADCANRIDVEFVPKGLHDLGQEKMVAQLQARIDAVDAARYQAILLGYALCNNGVVGLRSRCARIVVPRAHDCITLFMGSRERYKAYFDAHPGTFYRTSGWSEREDGEGAGETTVQQRLGLFQKYDDLVAKYGEENAQYIMDTLGDATANYDRIAFIRMGLACEGRFRELAVAEAASKGWTFAEVPGSMELLRKLLAGDWDDAFLVLEPGQVIVATHDDHVLGARPAGAEVRT